MAEDLPFNVEYAKSGRASCKKCKENIGKDSLRMAIMVQSHLFDGKMPMWHHFACFFKAKNALKSTSEIANFANLRWEDQEKIKKKLDETAAKNGSSTECSGNSDFSVEYAKSNRSTCRGCGEKIEKGTVRISKLDTDNPDQRYGVAPLWRHVDCFVKEKGDLGYEDSADKLPGFNTLSDEDKEMLRNKVGSQGVKRKIEDEGSKVKKSVRTEDKVLKSQNKMLFDMRDKLKSNLSKRDMTELLTYNKQHISTGESRLLDHLADCLVFGALKECPVCKNDSPRFQTNTYKCPGHLTEWTRCQYETRLPEREEFKLPSEFKEKFEFLKDYKCRVSERQFAEDAGPSKIDLPLAGFSIAVIGKFKIAHAIIQKKIRELGATVQGSVSKGVNLCIGTKDEVDSNSSKVIKAREKDIHIVAYNFLESVKKGSTAAAAIKEHLICDWGGDPILKFGIKKENASKSVKKEPGSSKSSSSSGSSLRKITVHGAAAVDPESGKEDSCHVYQVKKDIYNAVLAYVDMTKGTNSFYKLQVLEHNKKKKYFVFRQWGRVGTTVGGKKVEDYESSEEAIDQFESLYREKSGNEWWDRENFVKKPGCMYPLDIDYGEESDKLQQVLKPGANSKLPKPVQELICLIFDIEAMKKAMVEFEIDLKKMPLGKLSKKQIQMAYKVLCEAQEILITGSNSAKIMDASNRFYTLIPHDFGMKRPPLLDDDEIIKSKIEMLDSLMEIEFAYNLIKGEHDETKDPVDEHYEKLNTNIDVLTKDTDEFKNIKTYIKNTHAQTHHQYTLELDQVYKINRQGEDERYKKFKDLPNKKLLWHGSRLTNYVGILSQGLRIAPPEAPCTGYMFGKGVYFADMVSKSANYCFTSKKNPTGILLLCEVALGNMYEKLYSEFIEKLPANKHSTKGMGQTVPNPDEKIFMGDVEVPCGKPTKSSVSQSSLLYNEYIVYDVSQVNIKYLLKVNFKWK